MPCRVVALVPLVLVPALGALQGGFSPGAWVWSGSLAAWAAALGVVLGGRIAPPGRAWAWVSATAAVAGWAALSALWSAVPAQSVLEARRATTYAAVALAVVVLAGLGATRALVASTHLAISGLVLYALARYLLGPRQRTAFEGPLLSRPLGYANAVGILAALGLVLALGLVAHGGRRAVRAAAAATAPPLTLALVLTSSNASWLALAGGVAATALLERSPAASLRALAVTAPGAAILAWLGRRSGLAAGVASPHPSPHLLAASTVACAAGTAAIAALAPEWDRVRARWAAAAAVVGASVGAAALAVRAATRQPRASYWHVAWHEFLAHPLLGSGAGTFGRYWLQSGDAGAYGGALDAHSLYLETLAELGPVGLALIATMLLLPLWTVLERRGERFVPAAAGAYVAFIVHAGLDWDWEMPAVVVAGLACGGALVTAGTGGRALAARARAAVLVLALVLGGLAIAGVRSRAVPGATKKAPGTGAFSSTPVLGDQGLP